MYRKLYIISILLTCVVWNTSSVAAQEFVLRGSTHRYSISPVGTNVDYRYTWSVSGGTSSVLGSGATTDPILWDGTAGIYTLSMFATDKKNGCAGNIQTFQVQIIDFPVRWQGYSTNICSSFGNEYRDFTLVAEFPGTMVSWSFEYQIDNTTSVKVTVNGGTTKAINIAGFINHSNQGIEIHKVRITKIIMADGHQFAFDGTELDAAAHMHTVTVNPLPSAGTIEFVRDL